MIFSVCDEIVIIVGAMMSKLTLSSMPLHKASKNTLIVQMSFILYK